MELLTIPEALYVLNLQANEQTNEPTHQQTKQRNKC